MMLLAQAKLSGVTQDPRYTEIFLLGRMFLVLRGSSTEASQVSNLSLEYAGLKHPKFAALTLYHQYLCGFYWNVFTWAVLSEVPMLIP